MSFTFDSLSRLMTRMAKASKAKTKKVEENGDKFTSIRVLRSSLITNNTDADTTTTTNNNDNNISLVILNKEFLMKEKDERGCTALLWFIKNVDKIFKSSYYDNDNDNKNTNTSTQTIKSILFTLIDIGGKDYLMERDDLGRTVLHWAFLNATCIYNNIELDTVHDIFIKLMDVGGKDLVCAIDNTKKTILTCIQSSWIQEHCNEKSNTTTTTNNNNMQSILSKLIDMGGKDLLMIQNNRGGTLLHHLNFSNNITILNQILTLGGKRLVMLKNDNGSNVLHYACCFMEPFDVVSAIIEVGGKDLVMEVDDNESSMLVLACEHNAPMEVILLLIDVGGHELVMKRGCYECSTLHEACENGANIEVIMKLIEVGGSELLQCQDSDGWTALLSPYCSSRCCYTKPFGTMFQYMFREYMEANIGGEFSIGGLFNNSSSQSNQDKIFSRWDEWFPLIIESLLERHQNILHAAILARAPIRIIHDICTVLDCILTQDSKGRYPIDVAAELGLTWNEGMGILVEQMAQKQNTSLLYVGAKYGVKWDDKMKDIAKSNINEVETGYDSMTGLSAFMLAAAGECSDLSTVYSLIRVFPSNLHPPTKEAINQPS